MYCDEPLQISADQLVSFGASFHFSGVKKMFKSEKKYTRHETWCQRPRIPRVRTKLKLLNMKFRSLLLSISGAAIFVCGSSLSQSAAPSAPTVKVASLLKCTQEGKPECLQIPNLELFQSHYLRIFNRQGRLMYASNQYQGQWPDAHATENKYFYMLQLEDKRISGWIDIERCPLTD